MSNQVDHAEIKMGQILTIIIAASALVIQEPALLIPLGIIFLLSGTVRKISPFTLLYRYVIRPTGLMRSDYRLDNIQPHKFGQLVGVQTVVIALALIQLGYPLAGWSVVAILIVLTMISYAGWCIGCFIYYQLNSFGLGGFFKHPPTDKSVFMGSRPEKSPDEYTAP
ncbi:MAG: DUF4395 domain-containing protein [Gammaproteobacteria bacterium]|nr:DUF4395 domain-containing protein [Gammaproteobacteria bacterium]